MMKHTWKRALSAVLTIAMMATLLVVPAAAAAADAPTLAADGGSFTYQGKRVALGPHAFYVDGRLSAEQAAKSDYVFTSFNEAVAHLTDGTEAEPMNLYLAPYVYWIHDPKAAEATDMKGVNQMEIKCKNLHITGLTDDPQNVVVAANFGHDIGFYNGNYTMFYVQGDGLTLKNMTFGDYCNVDLVYPADPSLNMPARDPKNITQGQIGWYDGDKLFAENVRFISRLNMMPFNSNNRALYVNCHMECTDDALNGSPKAVYLGCDFEFYSSKPWAGSSGVTLLDCQMKIIPKNPDAQSVNQYLAKGAGPFTVVDSSFTCSIPNATIGWSDVFNETFKSYYANVDFNGTPITFSGGSRPDAGVDLAGKSALKAFKLADGTYNIYNLLRGKDDWDPMDQKAKVNAAGAADLPTGMDAYVVVGDTAAHYVTIESGGANGVVTLGSRLKGPQSTNYNAAAKVTWSVAERDKQYVELVPNADGTCQVTGINTTEETALVVVTARDASGLEAAEALYVRPKIQPAPVFAQAPVVTQEGGQAKVSYTYTPESMGTKQDNTRVIWYACDDAQGTNPIKIAEGRSTTPLTAIPLTQAVAGKHLMVTVDPKHNVSDYGQRVSAISAAPMAAGEIPAFDGKLSVDIHTFPVDTQKQVLPGFWTMDSYKPNDTDNFAATWTVDGESMWGYGTGVKNGTAGVTGIFNTERKNAQTGGNQKRGARMMYTPLEKLNGEMDLNVTLAPGKTAGQGFGSANHYMDFMVKYDPANHTGWGLRVYRKTGSTCGFALVSHTADGGCQLLTDSKESSMFLTMATVHVWTLNGVLHATVSSTNTDPNKNTGPIELSAPIPELSACTESGVNLNHTGTGGDNAIYLTAINVRWLEPGAFVPTTDKAALNEAITTAQGVYAIGEDVEILPAGTKASAVTKGQKFVTADQMETLDKAIANAKAVAEDDWATQEDVDKAAAELTAAVEAFEVLTGTKSSGSSNRPSSRPTTRPTETEKKDEVGNTAKKTTDGRGNTVITVTAENGETIAKVDLPATIPAPKTRFADVPEGHWAEQAIHDLAGLGMVKGVNEAEHIYDMTSPVTRGSVATILFRVSNGKAGIAADFSDVTADAWYADAVGWAAKYGIVTGGGDGAFAADDSITREQLAVMLYRYAKLLGVEVTATANLDGFADAAGVSAWAAEAMTWAVGAGIIKGTNAKTLESTASASRAETACMIDRFIGLVK